MKLSYNTFSSSKPATSDVELTASESFVLADTSGGGFAVTLPDASENMGSLFTIKKVDGSANQLKVYGKDGALIEGESVVVVDTPYGFLEVVSDGAAWLIFGRI